MKTTFTHSAALIWILAILLPAAPAYAQFQHAFGTPLDESFSKVIQSGTNYYVLGSGEIVDGQSPRATVTRLNASGQLQWTLSLNVASEWNDAVLTPSGNLLVVGNSLPNGNSSQSIMGQVTAAGAFSWVRSYESPGDETFKKIVRNPLPQNAAFPYYILGSQTDPVTMNADMVLLNCNESGAFNWKKIYTGPIFFTGNKFARDLEALPNGDMLLAANLDVQGVVLRIDNTGQAVSGATPEFLFSVTDLTQGSGGTVYAIGTGIQDSKVHLMKFDSDLIGLWDYTISGAGEASQVIQAPGNGDTYVMGKKFIELRPCMFRISETSGFPDLTSVKLLNGNATAQTGGTLSLVTANQLAYADGRSIPVIGFGQFCAFLALTDLSLSSCIAAMDDDILLPNSTIFSGPLPPDPEFYDVPMGVNLTGSLRTWQQGEACGDPCEASFTVTPLDNCGHVQVISTSIGQQPLSYQWCSGENTPNLDLQLPCGSYTFCVSVTCADGSVSSATQTYNVVDVTAPVIECPASIVVSASNLDSCTAQVNNLQPIGVSDNCSNIQIAYQVTGATSAAGLNNASGLVFNVGVSTVTYVVTDQCGNVSTCSFTVTVLCEEPCSGNIIQNQGLELGAVAGSMNAGGSLSNWQAAYGTPEVFTDFGCDNPSYIQLSGDKTTGSAVYQQLSTPIQKGKVYELSVCVRVKSCSGCVPYVKFRSKAFNGALPNTGLHPAPDEDIAIIDVSGRIPLCNGDWTKYVFHRWRAPKDFNNIAISVENSEAPGSGLISIGDIDNICFSEVNDSIPCYLADLDSLGNLIPPFGVIDPNCTILEDSVDIFMGNVNDIYAYCNPAPDDIDTWYEFCRDSCESIGGELPPDLLDFIENDSLDNYMVDSLGVGTDSLMSDLSNFLDSLELAIPAPNMLDSIMNIGALVFNCRSLPPQGPPPNDPDSPFNGRDIVFVHGLRSDALEDRLMGNVNAQTIWPINRPQFYQGYWKRGAYSYWNTHTNRYLKTTVNTNDFSVNRNGNYSNRYLVVAHPATQNFTFGAHAIMEQIANAMIDGTGVVNCDPNEQRPANTFGHNGFIIISHSDGAPLSDIALTTSHLTKYPPLSTLLGDVSFLSERCELHVALQGAFGGSNYATLALMGLSTGLQYVKPLAEAFLGFEINQPANWMFNSQLLDMSITKHLWGPLMEQVPVCVLTLTGGHPTDFSTDNGDKVIPSTLVKHGIHHGFDDGVLSIESQTASPYSRLSYPSRFLPESGKLTLINPMLNEKLYDMGIHKDRANRYYLDQKLDVKVLHGTSPRASSGSIPWLSPSGMVQPVAIPDIPLVPGFNPLRRYNNHYSFIQSTADHYSGSVGGFPNFPDYEKTYHTGAANSEESRVVTSGDVYTKCGVNATKLTQVEYVRGKRITFKIFRKTYTRWIWKRRYHLLKHYDTMNQLDYLYLSVLK